MASVHLCFPFQIILLFLVISWAFVCRAENVLVCKSVSDSCPSVAGGNNNDEKIRSLEEQIRELRKIVGVGNVSSPYQAIEGIPRDCGALYDSGIRIDGVYSISPDGRCPFYVYCDMGRGGWTVIQRRQYGTVNFYQPWTEYVKGFGDVEGEYWLGLDKIHRLTKEGTQIYFHLENFDGSVDTAHYQSFVVHDVTTAYRMNVDSFGYSGTLSELLSFHDNRKFSTFDRDNDASSGNCCTSLGGGGWWYNNCYRLGGLNGIYGNKEPAGIGYWTTVHNPVKNTVISIKQREGVC